MWTGQEKKMTFPMLQKRSILTKKSSHQNNLGGLLFSKIILCCYKTFVLCNIHIVWMYLYGKSLLRNWDLWVWIFKFIEKDIHAIISSIKLHSWFPLNWSLGAKAIVYYTFNASHLSKDTSEFGQKIVKHFLSRKFGTKKMSNMNGKKVDKPENGEMAHLKSSTYYSS